MIVKDDRLVAFVSLNNNTNPRKQSNYDSNPSLLYDEITKQAKKTLPHYMIPKIVQQIKGEFPQTANGKLDKLSLAAMVEANKSILNNGISNRNEDDDRLANHDDDVLQSNGVSMATFLIRLVVKLSVAS